MVVFPRVCDITLSSIALRCPPLPFQTCSVELCEMLAGVTRRLIIFARAPFLRLERGLFYFAQRLMQHLKQFRESYKLQYNLVVKRFYIKLFLLQDSILGGFIFSQFLNFNTFGVVTVGT